MTETKQDGEGGNETAIVVAPQRVTAALARLDAEAIGIAMANTAFLAEQMIPNMVPEYHFGNPKDKHGKEAWDSKRLLEPGASLIRNAFQVVARPMNIGRTETDEGHIRYEIMVGLYPVGSPEILLATGSGSCSTEETKYAYRWVKADQIPPELEKSHLKRRSGSDWEQFRVPNPDLGDVDNTVLKMALKRAEIDGTYQLPGCSEIVRLINPEKYPQKTQRQMEETAKKVAPVVFGK